MNFMKNLSSFTFLFCCLSTFAYGDVCVKTGPCLCVFWNGTGINLTPADTSGFYSAKTYELKTNGSVQISEYYYHPCFNSVFNATQPVTLNTCVTPLSICRYVQTVYSNGTSAATYDFMGKTETSSMSNTSSYILYDNGPSSTIVLLKCAPKGENKLYVNSLQEPNQVVLEFYSRDACLQQIEDGESGRSIGSTLLIIFFSFLIFYLVLGICTKKFLMGATGVEVIPNLAFWTELPELVKDGWRFMVNGFKLPARGSGPTVSPDPNSYDSI